MNTLIVIILLLILLLLIWHIWQADKTNCITPEYMESCMEVSIQKQFSEHDRTYKQTIEECEDIIINVTRGFYKKYYPAEEAKGYSLYDLVAKYGLENVIDNWDNWKDFQNCEAKDSCKDCRAWSPRGGEQGFCRKSPHRCKANEGCEDFERREENERISD